MIRFIHITNIIKVGIPGPQVKITLSKEIFYLVFCIMLAACNYRFFITSFNKLQHYSHE